MTATTVITMVINIARFNSIFACFALIYYIAILQCLPYLQQVLNLLKRKDVEN